MFKKTIFSSLVLILLTISTSTYAGETSTYDFTWLDPDKEVYVLQNRKFRKAGKIHFNLGAGITTSGAFVDSKTMLAKTGYFFAEEWGVEFVYAKNSGSENTTAESVRARGSVPFRRIVDGYYGAMFLWSPFYAKLNTFNSVMYLDWIIGLGAGQIEETNNKPEFINDWDKRAKTETHTGLLWETALQFYLAQHWAIRLDLTVMHFEADKASTSSTSTEKQYYSNYDLGLTLGFLF